MRKIIGGLFRFSDDGENQIWCPEQSGRGPNLYPHNTYHGPVLHQRAPINPSDFKPLRFTDSPQNYYMQKGPINGSTQPSTQMSFQNRPSHRNGISRPRRSSNASSDEEVI
jgi:hypothetical protein